MSKNSPQTIEHDTGTAVAPQKQRPMVVFRNDLQQAMPTMTKLLPAHVSREKFEGMVISAVLSNPDLLDAPRATLMQAVADTADLGLSLNKQMREADILLVSQKAQMRPRYEGLVKLAMQSGEIVDVYAHEVYANDHFRYELGLNKVLEHTPAQGDRGPLTQEAYCVWTTKAGVKGFEVIGPKRIARAKAASEGYKAWKAGKIKSTPWNEDEAQMIRKTAIRAAASYMPKSTESDKFQRALAMADDTNFEDDDHVGVPSEPRVVPPKPTRTSAKQDREAAERMRQEQEANEENLRDQARGDQGHDQETGEVRERKAEPPKETKNPPPKPNPNKTKQEIEDEELARRSGDPEQEPSDAETPETDDPPAPQFDPKKTCQMLLSKVLKIGNQGQLSAMIGDYALELEFLRTDAPAEYTKVQAAIDGKKNAFKQNR